MPKLPHARKLIVLIAAATAIAFTASCSRRLVEVFDNGPVGGQPGPSEGYIWVGQNDMPPCGKHWKPTDPATLTAEQRKRIR